MGGIDEAIPNWHVYSVGARDVVSAHLGRVVQMEGRAIGPPGDDGLAGFVLLYRVRCGRWLLDLRDGQALALLNVENSVIGQHKRWAAVLIVGVFLNFCFAVLFLWRVKSSLLITIKIRGLNEYPHYRYYRH